MLKDYDWERLTSYSARHHGVVTLQTARELGVPDSRFRSFIRSGKLTRQAPGVYTIAGGPRSWHSRADRVRSGVGGGHISP